MTNYETRPEDRHATRGAEPRRGTPPAPGPEQPTASFGATAATTTREDERYEEQRYGDERYGDEYGQRYRARREEHEDYEEPRSRRSVMGLVSGLAQDAVRLVRQEAELAKAEMSEKVDQARNGLVELGAGAAIAYAGFLVLLASATFALARIALTLAARPPETPITSAFALFF